MSIAATAVVYPQTVDLPVAVRVAFGVYSATLIAMYIASAMSHAVMSRGPKHLWRVIDQGVIYLLIVGTYTPIVAAFVPNGTRAIMMSLLWAVALAGCLRKLVWQRDIIQFSAKSYLALGWIPALCVQPFVPMQILVGLLVGGIFYSTGAWFLLNDRRAWYFHSIWHVFVIIASICHYYTIWRFVLHV